MSGEFQGSMWRVVFGTLGSRRFAPSQCGPWHPSREFVDSLANRFRGMGLNEVLVQAVTGECYESGNRLVGRTRR
ncbi:MAG TPA: hypothetical protein VGQ91_09210 [Ideonella sp.]|jgi:hypothetical protein|nr:hypothetical protein [Ideonella sp.]